MKKITLFLLLFSSLFSLFAQLSHRDILSAEEKPEVYLNLTLNSKDIISRLSQEFSVDKVSYDSLSQNYSVLLWLAKRDYQKFLDFGLDFSYYEDENSSSKALAMAYSYSEMLDWNKYPTYSTYLAMMDSFQKKYPTLCKIDTILAATPRNHAILVAHISSTLHQPANKPDFLYSSTMHGDEVTGYHCMLRLIHYLLSNYENDAEVRHIVNNVNLWICPVENPDGTYYSGNNIIGSSPTSTRSNSNGVDLNRYYPNPLMTPGVLQPEINAMIQFFQQHHFVLSANFHGGAELANYPWDSWTTRQKSHADDNWWRYVARNYADSCQFYGASNYFKEENNGITNGGDWYVVYGSRQDYLNYYKNCREITLEISTPKTPNPATLTTYWNANKRSFLNYIKESLYGFRGTVFDAYSEAPIEAEIFVNQHDTTNSQVYSYLPLGNYHRPIKGGTYSVTFSAAGYCPRTFTITTHDKQTLQFHVALTPCDENGNVILDSTQYTPNDELITYWDDDYYTISYPDGEVPISSENDITQYLTNIESSDFSSFLKIYPNPANDFCIIQLESSFLSKDIHYQCVDLYGKKIFEATLLNNKTVINLSQLRSGLYLIQFYYQNHLITTYKLIKN